MFTDEQDIERTLKAALNVEPSGAFEAGVRQRVEQGSRARRFTLAPWLAAAAALALLAGGWFLAQRNVDPVEPIEPATMAGGVTPPAGAPAPVPDNPPTAPERASAGPKPSAVSPPSRPVPRIAGRMEPEVIVPAGQLELVRRLVREVQAERLELPAPVEAGAEPPPPLIIEPVVIEPIPVVSLEPGSLPGPVLKGLQ